MLKTLCKCSLYIVYLIYINYLLIFLEMFLMNISSYMPARVINSRDCVTNSAGVFSSFGKKCLIVTSGSAAKKSGALSDTQKALENAGVEYEIFDSITENPLTSDCFKAGEKARNISADFIIGIGGGSPLDASKAAAIYASNKDMHETDIYSRSGCNAPLPVILIGTTAGTGSEVTGVSVLTNSETGCKKSISGPDCYAKVSFCDSKYTFSVPYSVTVSSGLDAFAHCVESYFAKNSNELSVMYAKRGIELLWKNLVMFYNEKRLPTECERDELYTASLLGGLAINITGTCFPHTVGYVLTEDFGIPHGRACTAFMNEYVSLAVKYEKEKADEFFRVINSDRDTFERIINSLTDVKIKMSEEEIDSYSKRWVNGVKNFERTPGDFTHETARAILKKFL